MPHFRFDPMKELDYLSQRMRKIADEFPETFSIEFGKGFEPKVDVYRDDTSIIIIAELAGLVKSDVSVSIAKGVLTIQGAKKAPEHDDKTSILRCERSFGEFSRKIELPGEVDAASVHAKMENGLLIVTLKNKVQEQEKEISIDIG